METADVIRFNGTQQPLAENLASLLAQQGIGPDRRGVAVAVNGQVVRRADWPTTPLCPGDRVEVVTARQGG